MKIPRKQYADLFGPTVGDRVRLADTELLIEIEKDFTSYGDEAVFGGGKVLRDGRFQNIWIQPAAGDAGGAVGAALAGYHLYAGKERSVSNALDGMSVSYLGPEFDQGEIEEEGGGDP